jgi:hypothetical protein
VVCGNLIASAADVDSDGTYTSCFHISLHSLHRHTHITHTRIIIATTSNKPLTSGAMRRLAMPVAQADAVLSRLALALPIDLVPGARDPATFALPQASSSIALSLVNRSPFARFSNRPTSACCLLLLIFILLSRQPILMKYTLFSFIIIPHTHTIETQFVGKIGWCISLWQCRSTNRFITSFRSIH